MIRIILALLVVAISAAAYALTGSSPVVNVPISVTTGGGGGGGTFTGPAGACAAAGTGTVTVSPSITCQTMDGFGAMGYNVNSTVASQLWGTSGLGFSISRQPVPYFGLTSNPCNVVQQSCVTGGNSNIGFAQTVISAAGPDLKSIWTVWHYPAVLGTSGKDCPIDPGIISQTGTFLVNFLNSLRTYYSIVPSAVSVLNEPDDNFSCGQTQMTAQQLHDAVSNIGSAFASNNITVPIMIPETFQVVDLNSWLSPTMNDSTTAGYVTYQASHQYDTNASVQVVNSFIGTGKHLWETETAGLNGSGPSLCNGCWDPSIADGMMWAGIIDNWLAGANASAWVWWQPAGCGNPPADNECLESDDDVTISKRGYIIGNYAKFIRPGWVMISATHAPQSNVTVTAYKASSAANSAFAIVAQNSGGSNVSQAFSLNGQTTASVTPWLTSFSANLAQQPVVSVAGSSFNYTLIANSVTTFVGTFGSAVAGIACDVGQNATKIPAPAQAAGFTTCAANLDFTSGVDPHGVNWQDPTTFVKQCGGAIGNNEAMNLTIQAYPNSQSNDYNTYTFSDMPCAAVQQRMAQTDPLTNTKGFDNYIMSCDFRATPCESGFPAWAFVSSPFWPSPGAGPNSLGLYQPMYVQITHHWARGSMTDMATSSTCTNYPNVGACQVQYNDFWQNDYSGHAVGTELDYWETHGVYVSSNDGMDIGSQWGTTSDANPATTAYRTDGFLITTNPAATERRNCGYIGQSQIDSGVAFGCNDSTDPNIKIIANSSDYWIEDRVHIGCFANPVYNGSYGWIGDANSGSTTSGPCLNVNTKMEHWVSDIQVWECATYWAAPCYGTVITSEAKTPKKWYAKLKDLLERLSPITPAYGGPPEPFTHPWRGLWVCPDGSIDPTEKCRPPELSGKGNEWWKACVPGRDDCVWSDEAHIGQRPDDPAKGARGGGYCYTKQPFTCSPGGVVPK